MCDVEGVDTLGLDVTERRYLHLLRQAQLLENGTQHRRKRVLQREEVAAVRLQRAEAAAVAPAAVVATPQVAGAAAIPLLT